MYLFSHLQLRRYIVHLILKKVTIWIASIFFIVLYLVVSCHVLLAYKPLQFQHLPYPIKAIVEHYISPNWLITAENCTFSFKNLTLSISLSKVSAYDPHHKNFKVNLPNVNVAFSYSDLLKFYPSFISVDIHDAHISIEKSKTMSLLESLGGADTSQDSKSYWKQMLFKYTDIFIKSVESYWIKTIQFQHTKLYVFQQNALLRSSQSVNFVLNNDIRQRTQYAQLSVQGSHGPWGMNLVVNSEGRTKKVYANAHNVSLADLLDLTLFPKDPFLSDLKFSFQLDASASRHNLETFTLDVNSSQGYLLIKDTDFNPYWIKLLHAHSTWNPEQKQFDLLIDYKGNRSAVTLKGNLTELSEKKPLWKLNLHSSHDQFSPLSLDSNPLEIDAIDAHLLFDHSKVNIEKIHLKRENQTVSLSGTVSYALNTKLNITASDVSRDLALRLWPENIAPSTRYYLATHLLNGTLKKMSLALNMTRTQILQATSGLPVDDKAYRIDFEAHDATLNYAEQTPPLQNLSLKGIVTARTATVFNTTGKVLSDGQELVITYGSLVIPELKAPTITAHVNLDIRSKTQAVLLYLRSPALSKRFNLPFDPSNIDGNSLINIKFPVELTYDNSLDKIPLTIQATLDHTNIKKVFKDISLINGNYTLLSSPQKNLSLEGSATLSIPDLVETLVTVHTPKGETTENILFNFDLNSEQMLKLLSSETPSFKVKQLSGVLHTRGTIPYSISSEQNLPLDIDLDFGDLAFQTDTPFLGKPLHTKGAVTFTMHYNDKLTQFKKINLNLPKLKVRGDLEFDPYSRRLAAELQQFKLAPTDNLSLRVQWNKSSLSVTGTGKSFDAKNLLEQLNLEHEHDFTNFDPAQSVTVNIDIDQVSGYNFKVLSNVQAFFQHNAKEAENNVYRLSGTNQHKPFSLTALSRKGNVIEYTLDSKDGGSILSFFDIYTKLNNGHLFVSGIKFYDTINGQVFIKDFSIKKENLFQRVIKSSQKHDLALNSNYVSNSIDFSSLKFEFSKKKDEIAFRNAALTNPLMGFTANGQVDFVKDWIRVNGTFIPVYGLNNIFSQIPLLGTLLGNTQDEGLIAMNFELNGKASDPKIQINPLSIFTPGILREFFFLEK